MHEVIVVAKKQRMSRIALSLTLAPLAMLVPEDACRAQDLAMAKPGVEHGNPGAEKKPGVENNRMFYKHGTPHWLKAQSAQRISKGFNLRSRAEWYDCGCYDEPDKHYPYSVVLFKTPKGDLVARPDVGREVSPFPRWR